MPKGYERTPLQGFRQPFAPDQPPHRFRQMIALADVHATFSDLERYLRAGDLLPGPDRHRWSMDQPAHEVPTGTPARVLARRLKAEPRWLVTAWAADGVVRDVTVEIPDLGTIALQARSQGTIVEARPGKDGPILEQVTLQETKP